MLREKEFENIDDLFETEEDSYLSFNEDEDEEFDDDEYDDDDFDLDYDDGLQIRPTKQLGFLW